VWFILVVAVGTTVWRRRGQWISKRGMGPRADLERLREVPRVRVGELTMTGPDAARLVLVSVDSDAEGAAEGTDGPVGESGGDPSAVGLEFEIEMNEDEPGYPLLREWIGRRAVLGFVLPPDSRLIRLRNLDDLQPLTLRRTGPRS
jgi:hypothetical protein